MWAYLPQAWFVWYPSGAHRYEWPPIPNPYRGSHRDDAA
jgi:hypothetical protein